MEAIGDGRLGKTIESDTLWLFVDSVFRDDSTYCQCAIWMLPHIYHMPGSTVLREVGLGQAGGVTADCQLGLNSSMGDQFTS